MALCQHSKPTSTSRIRLELKMHTPRKLPPGWMPAREHFAAQEAESDVSKQQTQAMRYIITNGKKFIYHRREIVDMSDTHDTWQAARKHGKRENARYTAGKKEPSQLMATSPKTGPSPGAKRHSAQGTLSAGGMMQWHKRLHVNTTPMLPVHQQQQAVKPVCGGRWPPEPANLAIAQPAATPIASRASSEMVSPAATGTQMFRELSLLLNKREVPPAPSWVGAAAATPTAPPALAGMVAPAVSTTQVSRDLSLLLQQHEAPQAPSTGMVAPTESGPQMSSDLSMLVKELIAQQSSESHTPPPAAWAPAPTVLPVVHSNCLCAAAGADVLGVEASGPLAAAGQPAQSSHCCSQVGQQQTPLQQQPQAASGGKCLPGAQHAAVAICPAAPVLGQPVLPHLSIAAANQGTSSSAWNSRLVIYNPLHGTATGKQVLLNTRCLLGSGGCGSVMAVDVKLCGADSLSTIEKPNTALARLLRRTQCACGVHGLGSNSRFSSHAEDNASSEEEDDDDDDDVDASPTVVIATNSGCCSIRMALKIATAYNDLPASVQRQFTREQYQQEVQRECYTEHLLMDKCSKSRYIIECYCVGFTEHKGQQQMCLLLELSQLGSAEQYTIKGGAARGRSDVEAQRIVQQVAAGLADMHYMANTLHRDVKLSNLLLFGSLQYPQVKLCDFGMSRKLLAVGDYGHTSRGTPVWMAPEQFDSTIGQDYRLDTYALGLLVIALRRAAPPFYYLLYPWVSAAARAAGRTAAALDQPLNPYNQSEPGFTALGLTEKAFVKRCLIKDISRRPAPSALLLMDPYLRRTYGGG